MPPSPNASIQMNVRLDSSLKQKGDASLQILGFTPTEAIRAVWELAAGGINELDSLKKLLDRGRSLASNNGAKAAIDDQVALLEQGWSLYSDALKSAGADPLKAKPLTDADIDSLREDALWGRLEERGLA